MRRESGASSSRSRSGPGAAASSSWPPPAQPTSPYPCRSCSTKTPSTRSVRSDRTSLGTHGPAAFGVCQERFLGRPPFAKEKTKIPKAICRWENPNVEPMQVLIVLAKIINFLYLVTNGPVYVLAEKKVSILLFIPATEPSTEWWIFFLVLNCLIVSTGIFDLLWCLSLEFKLFWQRDKTNRRHSCSFFRCRSK